MPREAILDRDVKLAGDINPMLARHGTVSEARQYSGRVIEPDWSCPYSRKATAGIQPGAFGSTTNKREAS